MVEASIMLPIFLFIIMAMAGAFRFLQMEETLLYSGFEQMRRCSVEMSLDYSSAKISRLYLEHRIIERTMEEMGKEQEDWIRLTGMLDDGMFFSKEQWDRQSDINCRIYCRWSLGETQAMGSFTDELRFSGRSYGGEDQRSVWVFPNWGERYHTESCYITGGERLRTVEEVAEQQGYQPCQICMKGQGLDLEQ